MNFAIITVFVLSSATFLTAGCHSASEVSADDIVDTSPSTESDSGSTPVAVLGTGMDTASNVGSDTGRDSVADTVTEETSDTNLDTGSVVAGDTYTGEDADSGAVDTGTDNSVAVDTGTIACDEPDTLTQWGVYFDMDTDGDADLNPAFCVNRGWANYPSEWYRFPGGDCNDSDPAFAGYRPDIQGDGVDMNCDGVDDDTDCHVWGTPCDEWEVLQPDTACEDGFDLAVVAHVRVGGFVLGDMYIVNNGTVTYTGQLLIEYNDGNYLSSTSDSETVSALSARLIADVSIPPGEERYVQMDAAPQTVSVIPLDGTDCYPENNSFEVLYTFVSIE